MAVLNTMSIMTEIAIPRADVIILITFMFCREEKTICEGGLESKSTTGAAAAEEA